MAAEGYALATLTTQNGKMRRRAKSKALPRALLESVSLELIGTGAPIVAEALRDVSDITDHGLYTDVEVIRQSLGESALLALKRLRMARVERL